jgi:hypothetical protein
MKSLNKWTRQSHRWIAVPTFLLIPIMVFIRLTQGTYLQVPAQFEMVQSLLMLLLAVSGAYLFFMPYMAKRRRNQRTKSQLNTSQT